MANASLSGGSSLECCCEGLKFIGEAMEKNIFHVLATIMLSSIILFLSGVLC